MIKDLLYKANENGKILLAEEADKAQQELRQREQARQERIELLQKFASDYTAKIFGEDHRIPESEWLSYANYGSVAKISTNLTLFPKIIGLMFSVDVSLYGTGFPQRETGRLELFMSGAYSETIDGWEKFSKEIAKRKEWFKFLTSEK